MCEGVLVCCLFMLLSRSVTEDWTAASGVAVKRRCLGGLAERFTVTNVEEHTQRCAADECTVRLHATALLSRFTRAEGKHPSEQEKEMFPSSEAPSTHDARLLKTCPSLFLSDDDDADASSGSGTRSWTDQTHLSAFIRT